MHWIVQNNLYAEEGFKGLMTALERLGLPHSVHKCVPFVGTLEPDPPPLTGPVVVMGSYTLARIAKERGWTPGAFLNSNFDFRMQHIFWGARMLNADSQICRIVNVPFLKEPAFLRPVLDSKSFTGEVMDQAQFTEWRYRVLALRPEDGATVDGDTLVQVSPQKEIWSETRVWIVDGRASTASVYKLGARKLKNHLPGADPAILQFAEETAKIWSPHRAYVMDVADTPEGLKVIEVNNLNSSGFYAADMGRLVMDLERAFDGDSL